MKMALIVKNFEGDELATYEASWPDDVYGAEQEAISKVLREIVDESGCFYDGDTITFKEIKNG